MKLQVQDDIGCFEILYDDLIRYHGKTFSGGLALAYKMVEAVVDLTTEDKVLHRDKFFIYSALEAPGIIDGLEYLTRCVTQKRFILDPTLDTKAPKAPKGHYAFKITHMDKSVLLTLKHGFLSDRFFSIASKCLAGLCSEYEKTQWNDWKRAIEEIVMQSKYENIYDIVELR